MLILCCKLEVLVECCEEFECLFVDLGVVGDNECFCVFLCEFLQLQLIVIVLVDEVWVKVDLVVVEVMCVELDLCELVEEEIIVVQ